MSQVFITSNVIVGVGDDAIAMTDDESLVITPNVEVIYSDDSVGGDAIVSNGNHSATVQVSGYVAADVGIYLDDNVGDTVSVAAQGSIQGVSDGIVLSYTSGFTQYIDNAGYIGAVSVAVYVVGDDAQIGNSGVISGATGVVVVGDAAQIENSGQIRGGQASGEPAVNIVGGGAQIENSGYIGAQIGLTLTNGAQDNVVNDASGTIAGVQTAITAAASDIHLSNAGQISSSGGAVLSLGADDAVSNSGVLQGVEQAIYFTGSVNQVENSGTIDVGNGEAVAEAASTLDIDNSGKISAGYDTIYVGGSGGVDTIVNETGGAIEAAGSYYAIYVAADVARIVNDGGLDGDLYVGGAGSFFTNAGNYSGAASFAGGGVAVRNAGHMSFSQSGDALNFAGGAGEDDLLVNDASGAIDAAGAIAVYHSAAGTFRLVNAGDIAGGLQLLGQTTIVNEGAISGAVDFSASGSLFVNRGVVDGNVAFAGTGNIYRGQSGAVTGAIYGAGADGRYMGGDADDTFDLTASGAKYVSGGAGDDTFLFTAAGLTAATTVLGGDGTDALDFTTGGTIAASAFAHVSQVETINLSAPTHIAVADPLVNSATGATLTVNGSSGADTITATGLASTDTLILDGGAGIDTMTVGVEKDVFRYAAVSDSTGPVYDTLTGVNYAVDRFDVSAAAGTILGVNTAVTTGSLSSASFNANLVADLPTAKLGAHEAVLFTASAGTLAGSTFLVIDRNGVAGYQANADLVIKVASTTGTLTVADFT